MVSPYKILGVDPSATDEEIKTAYRNLAKKYHPDNYQDSPLSDLAEEKMKEINSAYDEIMKKRKQYTNAHGNNGSYDGEYYDSDFEQIENAINSGDIAQAEYLLNQLAKDPSKKDARWFYYVGRVNEARGWYFEAFKNYKIACEMDPENYKYSEALHRMEGNTDNKSNAKREGAELLTCCTTWICADCCCECFGKDFIGCC